MGWGVCFGGAFAFYAWYGYSSEIDINVSSVGVVSHGFDGLFGFFPAVLPGCLAVTHHADFRCAEVVLVLVFSSAPTAPFQLTLGASSVWFPQHHHPP